MEGAIMRDYTALLEAGNKAQLEKLKKNGFKKGFDTIGITKAFTRLQDEVRELDEELYNTMNQEGCIIKFLKCTSDVKKVRHEAADIANFSHMIILACDKEIEK